MSDAEPDTFFGVVGQCTTQVDTPLEMYDFLMRSYSTTPKVKLLEFLATTPDLAELSKLDQPTLASIYAERMAISMTAGAPHL